MSRVSRRFIALILCSGFAFGSFSTPTLAEKTSKQTNVDQAQHGIDSRGVPQLSIDGVGTVAHPAWTALYALAYAGVEDYDPSLGLRVDPLRFAASIEWLKSNLTQDKNGLWVWPYNFDSTYNDVSIKAPWSSAFAQATGIQALLADWKQNGNRDSLEVAKKAAESLFVPLNKGGFLFTSGNDIWFEEIPAPAKNPSHILNGHMRVLLALGELKDATGDARYQQWLTKGSDTLLRWLPQYDAGYWLRYDLNPHKDELLFRFANPYGFANPELAIDRIVLRDPVSKAESVLDVGAPLDAEGELRIAGNDWGQVEQLEGHSVRRLRAASGEREAAGSEGQMLAPYSYFYLKLPTQWQDNLRKERFELEVDYLDEKPGNLEVQMRSIAPDSTSFRSIPDSALLLSGEGKWRKWRVPVQPKNLGYWVGKTYGLKHAEYLSKIASRDDRFSAWKDLSRSYVNRVSGLSTAAEPISIKVPDQTPILPWYSMDDHGILLMHILDPKAPDGTGKAVYSPFIVSTQFLDGSSQPGLDQLLKKFNIDKNSVKKAPALKWLLNPENQFHVGDAIVYKFDFLNIYNDVVTQAPWQSAFGQTYVLKALQKAFEHKDADKDQLTSVLSSTLNAYSVDVRDGGLAHTDRSSGLFFEEVPNRTHVLNAQLSALPVISEVTHLLKSPQGSVLFSRGVSSLLENINKFDTGYWLRYDLNPKKELLFQLDWLKGESSPLIESISFDAPQFAQKVDLHVGSEKAFDGTSHITGVEWSPVQLVDGRQARSFLNGYLSHKEAVLGGTRHNVYVSMQLPKSDFSDYMDVQPHLLKIRYKDVSAGQFVVKAQSINEGNMLDFAPLQNAVITTVGDQQWKEAVIEVRPQDMGWYKGADYQVFEVGQLERIAKLTGDWFFEQYAERQRYFLDAKSKGQAVIVQPSFKPPVPPMRLSVINASPTYENFGFENALDGNSDNNYVAGLENNELNYVILKTDAPIESGTLKLRWETLTNYAGEVRVSAVDTKGSTTDEIANVKLQDGSEALIELKSIKPTQIIRIDFSRFAGQPRLLLRLIELNASASEELVTTEKAAPVADTKTNEGNFLDANDKRNPLSIFDMPVTSSVKVLSDSIVKNAKTEHQKALAIINYIDTFDVGIASSLTPDATIDERKGACGSFTNTFLALAAAQGLEGRVISLLNYPQHDGHAVAEIKLRNKWALYDPTYGAFYTLENNETPLSFSEIKKAYEQGKKVAVRHKSSRDGIENFTGKNIFTKAAPAGVIGPDKPFYFPLKFDISKRNALKSSEFGPRWQGASFIGAESTNQQQDWTFEKLKVGKKYIFAVEAKSLGGQLSEGDNTFFLSASIYGPGGKVKAVTNEFVFSDNKPLTWNIPFVATSSSQRIQLEHDYNGPKYRYMNMQSYKIYEAN